MSQSTYHSRILLPAVTSHPVRLGLEGVDELAGLRDGQVLGVVDTISLVQGRGQVEALAMTSWIRSCRSSALRCPNAPRA
jgi:hypothetical protein